MIYLTQLIYLKEGQEETFHRFEDHVLPLLTRHQGKLLQRWRASIDGLIYSDGQPPYEVHVVSFESEECFNAYMKDPERTKYAPLKEQSVEKSMLIKGELM